MAEDYGLVFLETSAMANINVEDAFVGLAKQVKQRIATEEKKAERVLQATRSNWVTCLVKATFQIVAMAAVEGPTRLKRKMVNNDKINPLLP